MDVWILRFPEPRQRSSAARDLVVLQRSPAGEESELEVLEVELQSSPLLKAVQTQVEQGRPRLILDLIHEKHMDSNDLAQILGAFKQAAEAGAELVIANPNSNIREIFRITRLYEVVELFDSVDAAAEHLTT